MPTRRAFLTMTTTDTNTTGDIDTKTRCGAPLPSRDKRCDNPPGFGVDGAEHGRCYLHREADGESRLRQASGTVTSTLPSLAAKLPGRGVPASIVQFITEAGSPRESSHARDGFLSYHAESHACGMGLAAGFIFGTTGDKRAIGVVVGIALYASRGESKLDAKVVDDIKTEPHYAMGAIPLGYIIGRFAQTGVVPDHIPLPWLDWLIRLLSTL